MKITVGNFTREVQGKAIADGVQEINVMDLFQALQVAYTGNENALRKNGFRESEER